MQNQKLTAEAVLTTSPIVPVMVVNKIEEAVPLAEVLVKNGVRVLEVTLRTSCALEAIKLIKQQVPDAIVGAGTVTTVEEFEQALAAGVEFIITPGLTETLIAKIKSSPVPVIPGIATASELMSAKQAGLQYLKFFPAEINGGVAALKALGGPFPDIKFCPTGGVNVKNFKEYLALKNVVCVGGSWFVPADSVTKGDYAHIGQLVREALDSL